MGALFLRDFRLALRAGSSARVGVLFFFTVITIVPFSIGPDLNLLSRIGPAMLWIGALLASLLGLDQLFQADRDDGSLDLLLMAEDHHRLSLTILVKCFAHWVTTMLPLICVAPLLGLFMNMEPLAIGATVLTLFIGTLAIPLIGAVGAALAITLARGGMLVCVIVLPFTIPILIFGVSASYGATIENASFLAPFLILSAMTLFFAVLGPFAAAAALQFSTD